MNNDELKELVGVNELEVLEVDPTSQYREYRCPFCNGTVEVEKTVFYGKCTTCQATVIDYAPLPHQVEFHKSSAKYRLNLGGYGTGKTTMCCAEVAEHALSVPKGKTLITAPKLQLVKDAILPELEKFIPPWFIAKQLKGNEIKYTLENGHEIVVYASNDEQNLRSLNLTMFYMEEASNIDLTIFNQLQARLRNPAGFVTDLDNRIITDNTIGIISSNPEQGWLVDDFLLISKDIYASDNVDKSGYEALQREKTTGIYASFLSSSYDNIHLRPGFIEELCVNKSRNWIAKYVNCSLEIREGAVYPDFLTAIEQPFPIPDHWRRVIGFDKGFRDPTAWLIGAIDPATGTVHIYHEYAVAEQPVSFHAKNFKKDYKGLRMYNQPQADPTILQRSDRDGRSYQEYFGSLSGVYLHPADNSIDMGIYKVRDYMHLGKLKFFSTLTATKEEATGYVFKERAGKEIPSETNNHLMDCLRYLIMPLPQNPNDFANILLSDGVSLGGLSVDEFWTANGGDDAEELGYYGDLERWD